jgi:putative peptidoglycan lipid II flippase
MLFSRQYGIIALAWGVCAAAVMQVLILLPALRGSFKYSARLKIKDKRFKKLIILAVPAMLSMAVNELNHMVDQVLAAPLPDGNIAAMSYAFKIITVYTGILLVPLTTVIFSHMSRRAAERDIRGVAVLTVKCVETVALVALPVTVISVALSRDIIRAVFMRGAFDETSLALTAPAFVGYVVGLLGFGLRDLINRAFNALQDTRTPLIISVGTVALNVVLDILAVDSMGIAGLALATAVSSSMGALALYMALRKKLKRMGGRRFSTELLKIAFATIACVVACAALNGILPEAAGSLRIFLRLAVCALGSLAAYMAAALLMGVRQLKPLIISVCTVALNVILDILAVGSMGVAGLALATSVSSSLGALALYMALRKKMGRLGGRRFSTELIKIAFASIACAVACAALNGVLPEAVGTARIFFRLAACALGSLIVYMAAALSMGVRQLKPIVGFVRRRYGGGRR